LEQESILNGHPPSGMPSGPRTGRTWGETDQGEACGSKNIQRALHHIVGNPVPADENRTRPNEPERHRIVGLPSVAASGERLPDVDVLSFCGGGGLPPVAVRGGAVKKPGRPCASVGSTVAD